MFVVVLFKYLLIRVIYKMCILIIKSKISIEIEDIICKKNFLNN